MNDGITAVVVEFYMGVYIADISILYTTESGMITLNWTLALTFN